MIIKFEIIVKKGDLDYKQTIQELEEQIANGEDFDKKGEVDHDCYVELYLDTFFSTDQYLLQFSRELCHKVAPKCRKLTWKIDGDFTDQNEAKAIGNCIGLMKHLYSLDLQIIAPYFRDEGACSLGFALKFLPDLHILRLFLPLKARQNFKKMSQNGLEMINSGIHSIPFLEIVEFNEFKECKEMNSKSLASYQHFIFSEQLNQVNEFAEEIERRKHLITSINLICYYIDPRYITISPIRQEEFFFKVFDLCFDIPYLTTFRHDYKAQFSFKLKKYQERLQTLLRLKLRAIYLQCAFDKLIKPAMTINPKLVQIDFYY